MHLCEKERRRQASGVNRPEMRSIGIDRGCGEEDRDKKLESTQRIVFTAQ